MFGKVFRGVGYVGVAMLWPAIVAHEFTHYFYARVAGADARIVWRYPQPYTTAGWREGTGALTIRSVKLAPTLIGSMFAIGVLLEMGLPSSVDPATVLVLGWWVAYTYPSKGDRSPPYSEVSRVNQGNIEHS